MKPEYEFWMHNDKAFIFRNRKHELEMVFPDRVVKVNLLGFEDDAGKYIKECIDAGEPIANYASDTWAYVQTKGVVWWRFGKSKERYVPNGDDILAEKQLKAAGVGEEIDLGDI